MPKSMPKSKSKSKSKQKHNKSKSKSKTGSHDIIVSKRLVNLLNTISNNRRGLEKSEINLPARLMQNKNVSNMPQHLEYSKSVSSTYTSSIHNGEIHSAGKEVVNDSTKPYIQVAELHNGDVQYYKISRNQSSHHHNPSKAKKTMRAKKTKRTKRTKKSKTTTKS
jgi:hypothetical protein